MEGLSNRTFFGFAWLFAGSGFQSIIQIIIMAILARLITPEEFGVVSIALVIIGLSKIFSQLGLSVALVQRPEIDFSHIRTAFTSSLVIGVFFTFIFYFSSDFVAKFFNSDSLSLVLKLISVNFFLDSFTTVSQALIQRKMNMKLIASSDLISYSIGYGFIGIVLAYRGEGMFALVFANISQAIVKAIFLGIVQPHSYIPFWNKQAFMEMIPFGMGHTFAKVANYFAGQGDYLVVGKVLDAEALGFYSRAYQLMSAPVKLVAQSLNNVLFPAIASIQGDLGKVERVYFKSIKLVAYASLVVSVIVIVNAREIVLLLLGENWLEVILPFQILASGTIFRMSYKISDSLIRALGDVYKRAFRQLVYALCVFLFSYIGHFWGIVGVSYGVLLAIAINFLLMANLSLRRLNQSWSIFFVSHFKPVLFTIYVGFCSWIILIFLRSFLENLFIREALFVFLLGLVVIPMVIIFRNYLEIDLEIQKVYKIVKKKLA